MVSIKDITDQQREGLLEILKNRFEENMHRHKNIKWNDVEEKLKKNNKKLWSLFQMEQTGGEPDVVAYDKKTNEYTFFDCAAESPAKRRSLCYDHEALNQRKEAKPRNSAQNMAEKMGIEILNEEQYRLLQSLQSCDSKTSSWIQTPIEIRKLGGAIFADRRYDHVFIYHNGAESYYASRGFRGSIKI